MIEEWKPVPGLEDYIEVSSLGRVRTLDYLAPSINPEKPAQRRKGRILSLYPEHGYLRLKMKRHGKWYQAYVHRMAALAFVPGFFEGASVDHLDGDRLNNRADNLQWVTKAENTRRQNAHGRGVGKGERHPLAKLADADVPKLYEMRAAGMSLSQIARHFGVSPALVHKVTNGKRRTSSPLPRP